MKTIYKLTDKKLRTYKGFQFEVGRWYEAAGDISNGLCSDDYFYGYEHPLLAVLHNPIHEDIKNPLLWKAEYKGKLRNKQEDIKCGVRRIRLIRQIKPPEITLINKVAYGILCALEVYKDKKFQEWGKNWIDDKNRNSPLTEAGYAGYIAETGYAGYGAKDSAQAANAALHAAKATKTAKATKAAEEAAYAAFAAYYAKRLNLLKLAKQAMKVE